jgi:hypothetical protein
MTDVVSTALQYAIALHQMGDLAEAERQYRRVLSLSRSAAASDDKRHAEIMQAHHNLGVLTVHARQPAAGIPHLRTALEANSVGPEAWTSYAAALCASGRAREALSLLNEAAAAGVTSPVRDDLTVIAKRRADAIATHAADLVEMLAPYAPSSAGAVEARAELTVAGANRLLLRLAELATGNRSATGSDIQRIDSLCNDAKSQAAAQTLSKLLNRHGSDKAHPTVHNYQYLYGWVLRDPESVLNLLEIGLGTNNIDVVSNMSRGGRPGASLRAFRDFLPYAKVYGADVDKRILFSEDRIETFYVDQTDVETFDRLAELVPDDLDLIIDDGLHSPDANLTSLLFALKKIRRGGWFVVEDINPASLPVWKVVIALLPAEFAARILLGHSAYVLAVQRLHEPRTTSLPR